MTRLPYDWFDRPIPDNVVMGEGTWLYSSFAFLHYESRAPRGVVVGRHCGLYKNTFFALGPEGTVTMGDYCTCVGAIFQSNRHVRIGNYVFIAHEVVIADQPVARPRHHLPLAQGPGVTIEDDVWIGARATVIGGVHIGRGAIIGAAAVVDAPVPAHAIVAGNPARIVGYARPSPDGAAARPE